jgi:hypothetical protein
LSLLELYWADVADRRVPPNRVVEPLDVVAHISPRRLASPHENNHKPGFDRATRRIHCHTFLAEIAPAHPCPFL